MHWQKGRSGQVPWHAFCICSPPQGSRCLILTLAKATHKDNRGGSNETLSTWSPSGVDLEDEDDEEVQKRAKAQGWSSWTEWSTCSRSCDGGVAYQLRRCHAPHGCKGDAVRYKICNMQPCPEQQDFRAHQCSAYDDVPYDGALLKWTPHYDYSEPCALTCRYGARVCSVRWKSREESENPDNGLETFVLRPTGTGNKKDQFLPKNDDEIQQSAHNL
uniref:ADAMTS cysteine-rich domain-containing protein n=1 Tax=Anopheles culicifacies TaxID=139723 RepID=A0A182LSE8_9DIPT